MHQLCGRAASWYTKWRQICWLYAYLLLAACDFHLPPPRGLIPVLQRPFLCLGQRGQSTMDPAALPTVRTTDMGTDG